MYYLGAAAIVRNEGPYLDEWLTYHKALGVECFFIYNNNVTEDGTTSICNSHKEVLTLQWPGQVQQPAAYRHCLKTFKNVCRWIAFFDIDEFYVPLKYKSISETLQHYEDYAALCTHWYIFGSSGHKTYSPEPVVERFTKREAEVNRHIKSIVNPLQTKDWVTAHKFTHSPYIAVDEAYVPVPELESRPEPATANVIQLNHYVTKSFEESVARRSSPGASRADIAETRKMPEFFDGHDKNEVEDLAALKIWQKIKSI